jgi:hypothetical protein
MATPITRPKRHRRKPHSLYDCRKHQAGRSAQPALAFGVGLIIEHLHRAGAFRNTGIVVEIDASHAAIVHCCGAFLGAWHWDGRIYAWTPAGYSQPQKRIRSPQEAAYLTARSALATLAAAARRCAGVGQLDAALGIVDAADNDNAGTAAENISHSCEDF